MKKHLPFISSVVIIVIIAVGFILIAQPAPSSAPSQGTERAKSTLKAAEMNFDFGKISMAAGNVRHSFEIQNPSSSSINIEKIFTSCMCTTAVFKLRGETKGPFGMPGHGPIPEINAQLQPGEKTEVEVIFDPAAHGPAGIGKIERTVYVENSPDQVLMLNFSAFVTP